MGNSVHTVDGEERIGEAMGEGILDVSSFSDIDDVRVKRMRDARGS